MLRSVRIPSLYKFATRTCGASCDFSTACVRPEGLSPPSISGAFALIRAVARRPDDDPSKSSSAKPLVDGSFGRGGAGGNRTPVRQPVDEPATTIPSFEADAASPAGRSTTEVVRARSFPSVSRLSGRQRSFPPSSPASVAGLRVSGPVRHCCSRFCCPSPGIRRRQRTAHDWQFFLVPRLASLSNSGRVLGPRH
jgi:hypothetical protein